MELNWVGVGITCAVVCAWCRPRAPERAALAPYSPGTRLRVFLPIPGWGDDLAAPDRESLQPTRSRARIAAILLPVVLFAGWFLEPRTESTPTTSSQIVPVQVAPAPSPLPTEPSVPKTARVPSMPTALAESEPETLEEKRKQPRLYGSAKVKPVYKAHDVEGARITQIQKGSFWDMLGFREGDVVIELHGEPVDTPTALVSLMNALERDERVALRVRGTDDEVRYLEFRNPDSNAH